MSEDRDDIVVLVDENGEETEFEHIDTIEFNGSEYVVLMPYREFDENDEALEEEDEEEDEVIILKIEHGDNGEDSFISIEDEEELDAVFEEFKLRMDAEEDLDEE